MADPRARRGAWAVAILVLLILLLLLSRCSGESGSTRVGAVPNGAGPAEPAPAPTSDPASDPAPAPDPASDPRASGSGAVTVDGDPVRGTDLVRLTGRRAVADGARVLAVAADEGFWLDLAGPDRVWVQLTGLPPESPYTVRPGDRVFFSGRITPNGRGFARRVGVTRAEGAGLLNRQSRHLDVAKRAVSLTRP